ncbi:MAG TPA: GNAT family N-acetyltransferase [Chloroflexota bacterium]
MTPENVPPLDPAPWPVRERPNVATRPLTEGDLAQAATLLGEAGFHTDVDRYALKLRLAPETCLAAEGGGRLLGVAMASVRGRWAWVGPVAVARDARGRGVGTRLFAALDRLLAERVDAAQLEVSVVNAPAIAVYRRAGFEIVSEVRALARWTASAPARPPAEVRPASPEDLTAVARLDRRFSAIDRSPDLEHLLVSARRGALLLGDPPRGYALYDEASGFVGPLGAPSLDEALQLVDASLAALHRLGQPWALCHPIRPPSLDVALESRAFRPTGARFYRMRKVYRAPTPTAEGCYLSSGHSKG